MGNITGKARDHWENHREDRGPLGTSQQGKGSSVNQTEKLQNKMHVNSNRQFSQWSAYSGSWDAIALAADMSYSCSRSH